MRDNILPKINKSSPNKHHQFGALRAISALSLREMFSTYGRTPGGYIWAFLEPIGAIAVLSIAFTLIVRTPPIGTSFILFFATGFLPFSLFSALQNRTFKILRTSKALLAYPRVVWLDAIIATFILTTITKILIMIVVIYITILYTQGHFNIELWPIFNGVLILIIAALGIGMINSLLAGLFPIWASIWSILTRPLLIASGVLIMYEELPSIIQDILWWNPLLHAVSAVRSGFYPTYDPNWVSFTYCYATGLTLLSLGLLFMRSWHKLVLEQ